MSVEFLRPALLALLPAYIVLVALIARCRSRRRGLHQRVALGMRIALTCLCVLALAGPSLLLPGGSGAVWILADASDSARGLQGEMADAIRTAVAHKRGGLAAGVIAFGGDAMVEVPLSDAPDYQGVRTAVDPQDSNLAGALSLAGALLPSETGGRVAVLSDGLAGEAADQARALARRGVAVDVLPFAPADVPDAQVTSVKVPASAYQGQGFSVTIQVDAAAEGAATLVLSQNRAPVATREVTLRRGENVFVFRDVAAASGVVTYEARLLFPGDGRAQNDSLSAYLPVSGAPRVLVVEGRSGEGSQMAAMLSAAGMECDTVLPAALPTAPEGLMGYDGVALVNVDYDSADDAQWRALIAAVRTLGRGLAVIGGDQSYALGGYRGSQLEDALPLTIDVKNRLDMPSLALMLVIDKSGSMSEGMFGTTRLELAKEAAMRAAEVLTENDQVGVIAFDDAAKWVVPLQNVEDVAAIQRSIGTIRLGGGTAFYTALQQSLQALRQSDAAQKHIIFLTDGQAGDSGYESLVDTMQQSGITLTTVAVGSGADARLLRTLAARGGGRAYAADEFDNLPKIFTKETYLVSGSYVQNRVFTPAVAHASLLTDYPGFPALSGYLAATPKALSTVELVTDREDPLLCWWQYGAGRVLCFTADSRGAWTGDLLRWDRGGDFYAGMVAFTLPGALREGEITAERRGDGLDLRYAAPEGGSGLDTRVICLLPDGSEVALPLEETEQGVYAATLPAAQEGAYALRVEQRDAAGALVRALEGGAVAAYSREYDLRARRATGALEELAAITGGRVLSDPADLLQADAGRAVRRVELAQGLLWALLLLLLLDIALRRFGWDAALERRWRAARERPEQPAEPEEPARKGGRDREEALAQKGDAARGADSARGATAGRLLEQRKNKKIL